MKKALLLLLVVTVACSAPSNEKQEEPKEVVEKKEEQSAEGYSIAITEIDNSVSLFVEDSLVFTSGTIHSSPEVDFQIDLTPYIITGEEKVRIELYNGVEPYNAQADPKWEVRYDVIINGEIVDFVHEFGDDNQIGKVFETTYIMNEWKEGADN